MTERSSVSVVSAPTRPVELVSLWPLCTTVNTAVAVTLPTFSILKLRSFRRHRYGVGYLDWSLGLRIGRNEYLGRSHLPLFVNMGWVRCWALWGNILKYTMILLHQDDWRRFVLYLKLLVWSLLLSLLQSSPNGWPRLSLTSYFVITGMCKAILCTWARLLFCILRSIPCHNA